MISSTMHTPLLNSTTNPQSIPDTSRSLDTAANTGQTRMNVGYGATPKAGQASFGQEMSIVDHFNNFFTRIVRNIDNYFISSRLNSQADNAAVSFFNELKNGSASEAGTAAKKFNDRMAAIHTEVESLGDPGLAKDINKRVKASTKKVADQYFDRLRNIKNRAKFVKEWRKLSSAHEARLPSSNNAVSPATRLTSKVLARIQRNADVETIRQTIKTLIPKTWVSAVYGKNAPTYSQSTQGLVNQLKDALKNDLPGKDETQIAALLNSKRSTFVWQFGVGEPYHPGDTYRRACEDAVNDYCNSNQSDLDLAICDLILDHLNWTSYLADTL
jgi:hypothetical protein